MVEMTFTLDDATAAKLRQAATRLDKSLREVVSEAIDDYTERVWRLGEREKRHLLQVVNDIMPGLSSGSDSEEEPVIEHRARRRARAR
jgi:hypothetical protein